MAIRPKPVPSLRRPEYIEYNRSGAMIAIFCKLCGNAIAKRNERGILVYGNDYSELKMSFDDGTNHVTNCCRRCLPIISASKELMDAIHKADVDQMIREDPGIEQLGFKRRKVRRFVKADIRGAGLP